MRSYHYRVIRHRYPGTEHLPLPFPQLITACILSQEGFLVHPDEPKDGTRLFYTSESWVGHRDATLARVTELRADARQGGTIMIDLDKDDKGKGSAETPAIPMHESGQSSQQPPREDGFALLQKEIKTVQQDLCEHHRQCKEDANQVLSQLIALGNYVQAIHGLVEKISYQPPAPTQNPPEGQPFSDPPDNAGPSMTIPQEPQWFFPETSFQLPPFPDDFYMFPPSTN